MSSCVSGRRGGTPKSQTDCPLLTQIAFPHFRGSPELVPSAFQESNPGKSRIPISETREERVPGFHENAEMRFETVIDSPFAISASRRAAKKCKKTHYFTLKSVSNHVFLNGRLIKSARIHTFPSKKCVFLHFLAARRETEIANGQRIPCSNRISAFS